MTSPLTPEEYVTARIDAPDWRDECRRLHAAVAQLLRGLPDGAGGYAAQGTLRSAADAVGLLLERTEVRVGCDAAWIPMSEREPPALVDIEALVVLRGHCAFPTAPGAMMWRQPDGHMFNIPAATHWRPMSEVAP